MTREEAIRWLEDIHRRFNPTGENLENEGGDVHLQALDMAIEALSAEARPTGEWIPVSERLPEKDEPVLATVWDSVSIAWRNIYGGWESAEDMYTKGDVTAWMPLPKPYREDGEA